MLPVGEKGMEAERWVRSEREREGRWESCVREREQRGKRVWSPIVRGGGQTRSEMEGGRESKRVGERGSRAKG